ncbi:MAG TPA: tetratricopeptide repeat protein [Solirubrobacteraceae bacterium]|nr:tetratricopeptide repeat protein [Solirubrobacteraceae bacterium]
MSTSSADAGALELARHYLLVDQPQSALDALAARQLDLDDPEVWAVRGWALLDLDRHEDAADTAREALGRWPDDVDFLRLLAVAEAQRDRLAEAEDAILAALAVEPDEPDLLATYADVLTRGVQLDEAGAVLDRAAEVAPDSTVVLRLRLNLAYASGHDDEARALAHELLQHDADDYQGHVMLGALDLDKLKLGDARERIGTAVRQDPASLRGTTQQLRLLGNPLMWPMWPIQRFGPGPVWVAAVATIFGLGAAGLGTAQAVAVVVWLVFCVYSWTVPALVERRLEREDW